MRLKKISILIISIIGSCLALSACHTNEKIEEYPISTEDYQETSVTETETVSNESEIITTENETEISESAENIQPEEYEYPIIITPTLTSNIEFAFESEDIFCIYNGEKYGYITKSGEEITDYIYDAAYPFSEGLACVMINGKYGFIDKAGKERIPIIYDDATPFHDGLAYFVLEDTYGFMRKDETTAFCLDCDSVSSFQEGLAYYSIDGMYGYIDKTGQTVIEASYSDADYFKNGLALVTIDGYKGAIDVKGNVVIPIAYESIVREEYYIIASTEEETKYYDLNGRELSREEYEYTSAKSTNPTQTKSYTAKEEEGLFTVYNDDGEIIFSNECFYAEHSIYGDDKNYILNQSYNSSEAAQIVILEENENVDLTNIILKNSITPRKKLYWDLTHGKETEVIDISGEVTYVQEFNLWDEYSYIKKAKFYNVDYTGNPILYCCEVPCQIYILPMSDSAFYSLTNGKLRLLVTGNECGGSARGDYVCLWKDYESGETLIGNSGAAGGFGGLSSYSAIYNYDAGTAEEVLSYMWIGQVTGNYENEDLIENAHLFYDDNDVPFSENTIQETEQVNEYIVNDSRVSIEEYRQAKQKYRMFEIYK